MSNMNVLTTPAADTSAARLRHPNQWCDGSRNPKLVAMSSAVSQRLSDVGMTEGQLADTMEISALRMDGLLHRHRSWTVVQTLEVIQILWPDDFDAGVRALVGCFSAAA